MFGWNIKSKFDELDHRDNCLDTHIHTLKEKLVQRIDAVEECIKELKSRIQELENKLDPSGK